MPVLDLNSSTLGYVRQVVRTRAGEIEFIVDYSWWWGWFGRPVAVPLEALGIEGGIPCRSICRPANMPQHLLGMTRRPQLCRPTQPYASRCLAVNRSFGEAKIQKFRANGAGVAFGPARQLV